MKDKTKLPTLIISLSAMIYGVNFLLGLIIGNALSGNVPSLCTLAWRDYGAEDVPRAVWTYVFEYVVVLFPAINILFTIPILAIVLADNFGSIIGVPAGK